MLIAGVDEVGRGPLAGPVVAGAVVFPDYYRNQEIRDSKQLSPKKREQLVPVIEAECLEWALAAVGPREIERINIRSATILAMSLAVRHVTADLVLVDGDAPIATDLAQKTVIKGDSIHVHIAAASILAKVYRDHLMHALEKEFPGYGFGQNVGYGTEEHRLALQTLGPCPAHRRTFSGVAEYLRDSAPRERELVEVVGSRGSFTFEPPIDFSPPPSSGRRRRTGGSGISAQTSLLDLEDQLAVRSR
jgi:ribonuclease HII